MGGEGWFEPSTFWLTSPQTLWNHILGTVVGMLVFLQWNPWTKRARLNILSPRHSSAKSVKLFGSQRFLQSGITDKDCGTPWLPGTHLGPTEVVLCWLMFITIYHLVFWWHGLSTGGGRARYHTLCTVRRPKSNGNIILNPDVHHACYRPRTLETEYSLCPVLFPA